MSGLDSGQMHIIATNTEEKVHKQESQTYALLPPVLNEKQNKISIISLHPKIEFL